MTKKGQKGTYHKPKPRVAVYGGVAIGALNMGGVEGSRGGDILFPSGGSRGDKARAVLKDLADNPVQAGVINGGAPAAGRHLVPLEAHELGGSQVPVELT